MGGKLVLSPNFRIAISPLLFGAKESSLYQDTSTLRDLSIAQGLVTPFHRKGRKNAQQSIIIRYRYSALMSFSDRLLPDNINDDVGFLL